MIDNLGHSNNMLLKTILHAEVEMEDGKKYLLQMGNGVILIENFLTF